MRPIAICVLLAALATTSCRVPPPGSPAPAGFIDCGAQAVRDHALGLVPLVNDCLVSLASSSVGPCLLGLVSPALGITEETVACVVKSRRAALAETVTDNPKDTVSGRAETNARAFMDDRGYRFK